VVANTDDLSPDDVAQALVDMHENPLLRDLVLLYDSMNWFQHSLIEQDVPPEELAGNFQYLIDELVEVLYRRGVVPLDEAEVYDEAVHRVINPRDMDDPQALYGIAQVIKRGFQKNGALLRPEEVMVIKSTNENS